MYYNFPVFGVRAIHTEITRRQLLAGAAVCVLGFCIALHELPAAPDRPSVFAGIDNNGIIWAPHISSAWQLRRDGVQLIYNTFGQHPSPRTSFMLASISKPSKVAAVTSVCRYVPEFRRITILLKRYMQLR